MTAPAVDVRTFSATIPAGTAKSAPVTIATAFPSMKVVGIHWKVPPGPSGLMGWRLTMSGGVPVIPSNDAWIVTDDDSDTWTLTDQPTSGQWNVTGYNTDIYDHTVYLDFLLELNTATAALPSLSSPSALSSPASSTAAGVSAG